MATPMRCRAHGRLTGGVCGHAGCFEPVEPDAETPDQEPEACSAHGCGMPAPCPLHSTGARRDAGEAAAYMAASNLGQGLEAGAVPVVDAELRFPWGVVALDAGELIIGRDYGAQCGCQIEEFANVSRRHAKVTLRSGEVFIEDQASTNGTTVNGRTLPEYQPTPLVDGDVLGFGAHLRAVLSTRRAAGDTDLHHRVH